MPSTLTPTTHAGHGDQPCAAADYRIDAPTTVVSPPGRPQQFTFRVLDPAGATVTDFEDRHDRPMHLIVASRTTLRLRPPAPLGSPTTDLDCQRSCPRAGWVPGHRRHCPSEGPDLVLTVDLVVPGTATGRTLPDPAGTTTVDDLSVTSTDPDNRRPHGVSVGSP
ncbi:MAG: hypothetical protein M5T61_20145 [Acidimicrobiia bacterium]|nr:hypothetical protein [Acidimicrobiia bacterium]